MTLNRCGALAAWGGCAVNNQPTGGSAQRERLGARSRRSSWHKQQLRPILNSDAHLDIV